MGRRIRYFVGVDPGRKGAFSVIDNSPNPKLIDMWKMGELFDMRIALTPYIDRLEMLVIEKAQAMSRGREQGVTGMFNYGVGYGKLLGLFEGMNIKYHEVTPMVWMRRIFGTWEKGTSKLKSAEFATSCHPDAKFIPKRCRNIHDGLTDATCLAHYGRRYALRCEDNGNKKDK